MAYTLKEKLWYTADKGKAVKGGDLKAAFLIGPKGFVISDDEAARLGLIKAINHENTTEGSSVFNQINLANGESVVDETNGDDPTEDDSTDSEETAVEGEGDPVTSEKSEEEPKDNKAIMKPENKRQTKAGSRKKATKKVRSS